MAQATTISNAEPGGIAPPAARRPDSAVKTLIWLASLFLIAGGVMLSLLLIKLAIPGLFDSTAFLSYGRLRPVAYALLVYGFGGTLTQAIAYYLTPRLVGAPLGNESVAVINGYVYGGLVGAGSLAVLLAGATDGEFAEFPLVIDIAITVSMLITAVLVTRLVTRRTEDGMYVSLLYILGAVWWYPALYIAGNVGGVVGTAKMLQTSLISAGLLTMAFPAAAVGAAYYVVVKETGNPLYSGGLARAGFWTLAGTALVAAPARFAAGPAPAWLETISAVMSLGLAVAALAVLTTLMLTISGSWDKVVATPSLKLIVAGAAAYAFLSVLAALQGFRSVGAVVRLTTWNDGLALGLMLVAVPLLGMGFIFHAFPRVIGRAIFGPDTVTRGVRLTMWAGGLASLLLIIAGLVSGLSWNFGVASGAFANTGAGFQETLAGVSPLYTAAALASTVAVVGLALLFWTVVRTFTSGTVQASEVLMDVDRSAEHNGSEVNGTGGSGDE